MSFKNARNYSVDIIFIRNDAWKTAERRVNGVVFSSITILYS